MKKILCVLLVVLMCLTAAPLGGFAELDLGVTASALNATGKCGKTATYTFDSATGELTIEGTGKINAEAFKSNHDIKEVVIGDGITEIGADAFNQSSISNILIGNDVTIIGNGAFWYCYNLTSIDIPDNIISIGDTAFGDCNMLSSVNIGDGVTTIGDYAFASCSKLTTIEIGDSITTINTGVFHGCDCLANVYYAGSAEEWNAINIKYDNNSLNNATIHFAETHTHTWDVEEITKYPTCTEKGEKVIKCKNAICEKLEEIPATGHEWIHATCTTPKACNKCGEIEGEAHGHVYKERIDVEATCENGGTKIKYCANCDFEDVIHTAATGHVCKERVEKEPTCSNEGIRVKYCSVCDYREESLISRTEHIWSTTNVSIDDTQHGKKCSVCGEYKELAIHSYTELVATMLPTCVTKGSETKKCACGDEKTEVLNENDNHDWGAFTETKAPTCTEKGEKERACKRDGCETIDKADIDALGHDMKEVAAKEATCKEAGNNKYYACDRCDKFFKDEAGAIETTKAAEIIAKGEHVFTKYYISKDATCTSNALEKATCDICGEATHERAMPGTMLAHTFKNYVSDGNATCKVDGTMTAVCEMCKDEKDTKTEVDSHMTAPHTPDAAGVKCTLCGEMLVCLHTYSAEKLITKTPTCTTDGQKAIVCSKCKANKPGSEEVIPATGHAYKKTTYPVTCISDGYDLYQCLNCNHSYKDNWVTDRQHNYTEARKEATCTAAGLITHICATCGDTKDDVIIPALGHAWGEGVVTKEPTCTTEGQKAIVCSKCKANKPGSEEVIPELDHNYGEKYVIVKAPTCTTEGSEGRQCITCGKISDLRTIPALGHLFTTEKVIIKAPTCTAEGKKAIRCERCHAIDPGTEEVIPATHNYPDNWSVVIAPDCQNTGFAVKVCFSCHDVIAQKVPKAGHADLDGDSKCDTCDKEIIVAEPEEPTDPDTPNEPEEKPCDCDCHAGGIKAFFFKLINFFAKIFDKSARVCECGSSH